MSNYKNKKILIFITIFSLMLSLISFSHIPNVYASSDDPDIANRVLCRYEDGKTLANLRSTDYFYYKFRSKSAVTSVENVSGNWLNKLLTVSGFDFQKVNEDILGRELNPASIPEGGATPNSGVKVSAFDRFGMAGLKWSSYQGEWKYFHVNACQSGQVSPTTYGSYYEGRLEPQSTYNEISTSKDPRTIQFDKGVMSLIMTAFLDLVANGLFSIAKGIVTLTIVFVGLSFTDVTTLMGLSATGDGGVTAVTMFSSLYDTVFKGFVLFAIIFTGLYILYQGIIKRQFRVAIGSLARTIIIFIIATIMAFNPSYWIGVPNKIATYGQAIVLSTMAGIYDSEGAPTLCRTEVGSIDENVDFNGNIEEAHLMTQLEKTSSNMQSLIGCQMWEKMLFRPWVRGQFGAEYEDLHDTKLGNVNSSWVGNGGVPVGGGETIDNWALFHLSTQTDAHAQVGDNNFRTVVTGVNADWWRVVDALSNYDEDEVSDSISGPGGSYEDSYVDQTSFETTEFWQTWIGNNSLYRIGTALMTIAFAILGSLPPLIFSFSSAMYGLGITLLMIMSPLFFLMGIWSGKGDSIFMGWLSSLSNMVLKRIGVSILLILSLAITMNVMDLIYKVGFVTSFVLLVIVSIILIKNKNRLLNMLASVNFGGSFDPSIKAREMLDKNKRRADNVVKIGLATAGGAVVGHKTGQGLREGASTGAINQIRNTLYQSMVGTTIIREVEIASDSKKTINHNCSMCYVELGRRGTEIAYRDDNGNYYCEDCAEELGLENLFEVVVGEKVQKEVRTSWKNTEHCSTCNETLGKSKQTVYKNDKGDYFCPTCAGNLENKDLDAVIIGEQLGERFSQASTTRTVIATKNRSYISHKELRDKMEFELNPDNDKHKWNDRNVQKMIKENLENLSIDILTMRNLEERLGNKRRPPSAPEPIHQYIDVALLNLHWTNGNYDAVQNTYKEAWKMWYEDNGKYIDGLSEEDIQKFQKQIGDYKPDMTSEKYIKMIERDVMSAIKNHEISDQNDKNLYVYKNGVIILNDLE